MGRGPRVEAAQGGEPARAGVLAKTPLSFLLFSQPLFVLLTKSALMHERPREKLSSHGGGPRDPRARWHGMDWYDPVTPANRDPCRPSYGTDAQLWADAR